MTLQRIQALRDLDYGQLANLAAQRGILRNPVHALTEREWSPDRLRLRLIDSIVDEELREQRMDEATGEGRR
jgi:hypothetical protein